MFLKMQLWRIMQAKKNHISARSRESQQDTLARKIAGLVLEENESHQSLNVQKATHERLYSS